MKKLTHYLLSAVAKPFGLHLVPKKEAVTKDMDQPFHKIYEACREYTMTSSESMYALYKAVEYVVKADIPGDFVECGVWRGGSAMVMAHTLSLLGDTERKIYLYDTFEGMPEPGDKDVKIRTGVSGKEIWKEKQKGGGWAKAQIDEVKKNVYTTKYPKENFIFVKGKVEETLPQESPKKVAILRLDTDWYESTYHELKYLYPILHKGGIIIIDDYGSWSGARQATDKYFSKNNIQMYLQKVKTGRIGVKFQ